MTDTPGGVTPHRVCTCHGKRMRWNRDARYAREGYWACAVSDLEQKRERYDTDPQYRLTLMLKRRRKRALAAKAKRHTTLEAIRSGEISREGRNRSTLEQDPAPSNPGA